MGVRGGWFRVGKVTLFHVKKFKRYKLKDIRYLISYISYKIKDIRKSFKYKSE